MTPADHAHERREVKWNLVLQYSTVAVALVQGVLLVPLYLRFVGSVEFGVWLVASGVATWIAIVDPGVATLMQQRISQALGGARPGQAVRLAKQGLRLSAALAAVIVAVGAMGAGWLMRLIDPQVQVPFETGWWLLFLSVVAVALGLIASYTTAVGVALRDARPHTLISVLSALAGIIVTVALLLGGWGVLALAAGMVARGGLQAALSLRLVYAELARLRAQGGSGADAENGADVDLRSLAWLALEKLTGTFSVSADLFVIGRLFDGGMVTMYVLTKRPVDLLVSLFQRPAVALSPTVSFLAGSGRTGRLGEVVGQASMRLLWVLGGAALGTALLLEPLVNVWVGPSHYLGGYASWILAVALAVSAFSGLFANLYWASGATMSFCRINSGLSALTIVGILIGLQFYGVMGLMLGALLPRLLLATWLFPRLALRALGVETAARRAIWREVAVVAAATVIGCAAAWAARFLGIPSLWWSGLSGLIGYAVALGLISSALRRDVRELTRGVAGQPI